VAGATFSVRLEALPGRMLNDELACLND
jgi:hypothetical protein